MRRLRRSLGETLKSVNPPSRWSSCRSLAPAFSVLLAPPSLLAVRPAVLVPRSEQCSLALDVDARIRPAHVRHYGILSVVSRADHMRRPSALASVQPGGMRSSPAATQGRDLRAYVPRLRVLVRMLAFGDPPCRRDTELPVDMRRISTDYCRTSSGGDDYLCSMKDRCWGDLEKRIVAPF